MRFVVQTKGWKPYRSSEVAEVLTDGSLLVGNDSYPLTKQPDWLRMSSGCVGHDPGIDLEMTTVRNGRRADDRNRSYQRTDFRAM